MRALLTIAAVLALFGGGTAVAEPGCTPAACEVGHAADSDAAATAGSTAQDAAGGSTAQHPADGSTATGAARTADGDEGVEAAGAVEGEAGRGSGRFDVVRRGWADAVLRNGTPAEVGLDPKPIGMALERVQNFTRPSAGGHPLFAGAVTLLVHDGVITNVDAAGWALRYADAAGAELPVDQRVAMTPDTIFDVASISKLFTSIAVMRQVELGRVEIGRPVARYLPEFSVNGKAGITVEQLLTHTSGLPSWLPLWSDYPDVPARVKAVMDVAPRSTPGSAYLYSDLNLITLGLLAERVSGKPLDVLVREDVTGPLGLRDTGYRPPRSELHRIAATEFQGARGLVRGEVHDENAWSLGGVAGHAGVFSTARDLAVLGQAILNGGRYGDVRVLRPRTVELMLTNFTQRFPGNAHGLGFELDQRWYMGALASAATAGHTGFTGTSLVLDPMSGSIAVLLTNRVHPNRDRGSVNPARQAVADGLARALAVRPRWGDSAWTADAPNGTLTTAALPAGTGRQTVDFSVFVDLETSDRLVVQASADGRTWRDLRVLSGHGKRRWERVRLVGEPAAHYRWLFVRGTGLAGRGVYVDGVRVSDRSGVLLDAERDPTALRANGWHATDR